MSASREKQNRKNSGGISPKTAREAQQLQEDRRAKIMYGSVGAALVAAILLSLLWNSNIISRSASAVTVDGRNCFYYGNAYLSLANSGWASILGLDTSASLETQYVGSTAAGLLDAVEGQSWKEYFLDTAFEQIANIQNGLQQAQSESYVFPDSVQENLEEAMTNLATAAETNGVSVARYLRGMFGAVMTEQVYRTELLRMLQYEAYSADWTDRLSYTDEEINAEYDENANDYDMVSYELVTVDGAAILEASGSDTENITASASLEGAGEDTAVSDGTVDGTADDVTDETADDISGGADETAGEANEGTADETVTDDDETSYTSDADADDTSGDSTDAPKLLKIRKPPLMILKMRKPQRMPKSPQTRNPLMVQRMPKPQRMKRTQKPLNLFRIPKL